jgi:hypothetical protein
MEGSKHPATATDKKGPVYGVLWEQCQLLGAQEHQMDGLELSATATDKKGPVYGVWWGQCNLLGAR